MILFAPTMRGKENHEIYETFLSLSEISIG